MVTGGQVEESVSARPSESGAPGNISTQVHHSRDVETVLPVSPCQTQGKSEIFN
jgi:hypothetical protein